MRLNKMRQLRYMRLALVNPPDDELKMLARMLNSRRGDSVTCSIRELFTVMKEFERAARRIGLSGDTVDFDAGAPYMQAQGFSVSEAKRFQKIGRIFDESKFSLSPFFDEENGWQFTWEPLETLTPAAEKLASYLAGIQALGAAGLLSFIRKCLLCGRWYVAVKEVQQRFCTPACRKKHYLTTEEGRRKRAAYMRRSRANERRLNENARRLAEKDQ